MVPILSERVFDRFSFKARFPRTLIQHMSRIPRSRLLKLHELSRDDRGGSCWKMWRAIDGDRSDSIFRSSVHDEDHEETSRPAGSPVQEPLTATFIFNFGVVRAFDLGLPLARFRLQRSHSTFPYPFASLYAHDSDHPSCSHLYPSIAFLQASILLSALR